MDSPWQPDDRNWSFDELYPLNQAQDLPDPATYTLFPLRTVLSSKESLCQWLNEVSATLRAIGIGAVIDFYIERPCRDDPNVDRWKRVSQAVVLWLRNSISTEVIHQMETTRRSMVFADDFVKLVKETLFGARAGATLELYDAYRSVKIDDFDKPSDYVTKVMETYIRVFGLDTKLPALEPLHRIIDALGCKGYDVSAQVILQLGVMESFCENCGMLSTSEFRSICSTIIRYLQKTGADKK